MKTVEKLAGNLLFINCATDQTRIALFLDRKMVCEKIIESRSELSDKLLLEIDQLIKGNNFQIDSVAIFPGPGSYTGLRIGITTANFLAWSLKVPIYEADTNGKVVSDRRDFVLPIYLNQPHITKPKIKK
ncbi:MAG: hypothetical protein WCG99_00965 [Candidatus Berkelbacteria bacterium]